MILLKKPLYHGTRCSSLDWIIESGGLRPSEEEVVHKETKLEAGKAYREGVEPRLARYGVYLTESKKLGHVYALQATCDIGDEDFDYPERQNACVLKIECMAEGARLGGDGFGDYMVDGEIPTECITDIIYPRNWKKEERYHLKLLGKQR